MLTNARLGSPALRLLYWVGVWSHEKHLLVGLAKGSITTAN